MPVAFARAWPRSLGRALVLVSMFSGTTLFLPMAQADVGITSDSSALADAKKLQEEGNYERALAIYASLRATASPPDQVMLDALTSDALTACGTGATAERCLRAVGSSDIHPEISARALLMLGRLQQRSDENCSRAEATFDEAASRFPDTDAAGLATIDMAMQCLPIAHEFGEAEQLLRQVSASTNYSPSIRGFGVIELVAFYMWMGERTKAEETLRQVEREFGTDVRLPGIRGMSVVAFAQSLKSELRLHHQSPFVWMMSQRMLRWCGFTHRPAEIVDPRIQQMIRAAVRFGTRVLWLFGVLFFVLIARTIKRSPTRSSVELPHGEPRLRWTVVPLLLIWGIFLVSECLSGWLIGSLGSPKLGYALNDTTLEHLTVLLSLGVMIGAALWRKDVRRLLFVRPRHLGKIIGSAIVAIVIFEIVTIGSRHFLDIVAGGLRLVVDDGSGDSTLGQASMNWLGSAEVIALGIGEEGLFRGVIINELIRNRLSPWTAVGCSAVLFSVAHLVGWRMSADLMLLGVVAGCLRVWWGSLLPSIVFHGAINLFAQLS